ncbi:hypothetical protein ACI48D_11160 [Massilia sp. LXY-6]|uniref:hypothetical protein n=1 Tax=Massilia sp. LXY-6 TaxID=3379823 RepID=UPI003EDF20F5
MKVAHRNIIRIVTVLALTAASTSAFAQSAEYRRGYDEGYAAGLRAAGEGRGGNSGWGRLHIEEAEYGARGSMCDARRGVRDEIERSGGGVVAHNQLCGDPAPGEQKRLRIIYRCGDSEPVRAFAREGETLRLRCPR